MCESECPRVGGGVARTETNAERYGPDGLPAVTVSRVLRRSLAARAAEAAGLLPEVSGPASGPAPANTAATPGGESQLQLCNRGRGCRCGRRWSG